LLFLLMLTTTSSATVTMVIPWAKGDSADHALEAMLPHLPSIDLEIVHMPGRSGLDGLEHVYNSDSDMVAVGAAKSLTTRWVNGEWDLTLDDWEPFLFWIVSPVFSVRADRGIDTMRQALELMRSGKLTVATMGVSSVSNDAIEALLNADRSLKANYHYSSNGAQEAIEAVLSGDADVTTQTFNEQAKYFKSGKLKPLAVFAAQPAYANKKAIETVQSFMAEPLPILNSTYGVLIPKHKTELIKAFSDAWNDLPVNVHVEGTIYAPLQGKRARWLLTQEVAISAWSISRQGKAKRNPVTLGIPTPSIPNY